MLHKSYDTSSRFLIRVIKLSLLRVLEVKEVLNNLICAEFRVNMFLVCWPRAVIVLLPSVAFQ